METLTLTITFEFSQPIDDVEAGDFTNSLIEILERECTAGDLEMGVSDFTVDLAELEL